MLYLRVSQMQTLNYTTSPDKMLRDKAIMHQFEFKPFTIIIIINSLQSNNNWKRHQILKKLTY